MNKIPLLVITLMLSLSIQTLSAREVSLAQKISSLYVAFFNRAPDYSGLNYWKNKAEQSEQNGIDPLETLKELSAGFAQHPTFIATYANMSNQDYVKTIYQNALGREGDAEGIAYWTGLLDEGKSRSDMLAEFISLSLTLDLTPQNFPSLTQAELDAAIERQNLISNKSEVAVEFANTLSTHTDVQDTQHPENDPAYLASIKVISQVGLDTDSVNAAIQAIKKLASDGAVIDTINNNWDDMLQTELQKLSDSSLSKLLLGKTLYMSKCSGGHLPFVFKTNGERVGLGEFGTYKSTYQIEGDTLYLYSDGVLFESNKMVEQTSKYILLHDENKDSTSGYSTLYFSIEDAENPINEYCYLGDSGDSGDSSNNNNPSDNTTLGKTYKVYGSDKDLGEIAADAGAGVDFNYVADHAADYLDSGLTFLGESTSTETFTGTYSNYLIVVEPHNLVFLKAIMGSDGTSLLSGRSPGGEPIPMSYYTKNFHYYDENFNVAPCVKDDNIACEMRSFDNRGSSFIGLGTDSSKPASITVIIGTKEDAIDNSANNGGN